MFDNNVVVHPFVVVVVCVWISVPSGVHRASKASLMHSYQWMRCSNNLATSW